MRVNNQSIDIAFTDSRHGFIISKHAAFDLGRRQSLNVAEPGIKTAPTPKSGPRPLATALQKSGFTAITEQLVVDNIKPTKAASSALAKNFVAPELSPAAQIGISARDGENLVALEFDPASGEIIDWYLPNEKIVPLESADLSLMKKSLAKSPRDTGKSQVQYVFEIPLAITYPKKKVKPGAPVAKKLAGKKGLGRIVQIFSIKKIKKVARKLIGKALTKLITPLEKKFLVRKERLQLFSGADKLPTLSDAQKGKMKGKRVLLFVHGILSSTNGAFSDIPDNPAYFQRLRAKYANNVIAYEHWTLSKDVTRNAKDLAKALPAGVSLDIVCHSRGAGVVRSLLEIPEISKKLKSRNIKVNKVCFVAGACEGSDLATEDAVNRLFKVINKMSILLGQGGIAGGLVTEIIKLVIGGLQELSGTESMDPAGDYIRTLNKSKSTLASHYLYMRANFDSDNMAVAALDEAVIDKIVFNGKANDVVVPFAGAGISKNYLNSNQVIKRNLLDLGNSSTTQSDVWHITFFEQSNVQGALASALGY